MNGGIVTIDHWIDAISTAYSTTGEAVQLFVREKRPAGTAPAPVVLFIHGGTYPAVADFDLPVGSYSWMDFLAARGFHVFAMDCVGYGYSSRNWMDDPAASSDTASPGAFMRSPQSDWKDIDAVVTFIRAHTGIPKVNLIGWSAGGPRAGGYAALHPAKIARLILLAPAYSRNGPDAAPHQAGDRGPPLRMTSRAIFDAMWDNEVKRPDQVDLSVRDAVWSLLMEIDPGGASWQPPVVRSPNTSLAAINRGWNRAMAAKITAPSLLITMEWDAHIVPATVRELFDDLTISDKVFATIGGTSHYLPWERDHEILHYLSASWLTDGTVGGLRRGTLSIDSRLKS
jgi:pimeloyl-ACP methyl ester carboxylesterase